MTRGRENHVTPPAQLQVRWHGAGMNHSWFNHDTSFFAFEAELARICKLNVNSGRKKAADSTSVKSRFHPYSLLGGPFLSPRSTYSLSSSSRSDCLLSFFLSVSVRRLCLRASRALSSRTQAGGPFAFASNSKAEQCIGRAVGPDREV